MALTAEQLKKYSLSRSDATESDHDKGIVQGPDGGFYSIDGFERQQRDGLDTDQGAVFKSSLEKDSGEKFSNFNTATDVEGALMALKGGKEPEEETGPPPVTVYSPRLAGSRAFVAQYEEDMMNGQAAKDLYEPSTNPTDGFLDRYKLKLGNPLESGNYKAPQQPTNPSKVASGKNDVSVDAASVAKTGEDEEKTYGGSFGVGG